MQSVPFLGPSPQSHLSSGDPLHASVGHLISRAHALPCSTAAQAFTQLVQPTSRFQLALDALLPLLNNSNEVCCILVDDPLAWLGLIIAVWNSFHNASLFLIFCIPYMHPIRSLSTLSNLFCSPLSWKKETTLSDSLTTMMAVSQRLSSLFGFCGRFWKAMVTM